MLQYDLFVSKEFPHKLLKQSLRRPIFSCITEIVVFQTILFIQCQNVKS